MLRWAIEIEYVELVRYSDTIMLDTGRAGINETSDGASDFSDSND